MDDPKGPALVFGASGEQGRAVVEGLLDAGYSPVYGFTRSTQDTYLTDALGVVLWPGDLQNPDHLRQALTETKAQAIFLTTTTEMPTELGETTGFSDSAEAEFQVIVLFFQILKECYQEDGLSRHVVFSTRDNVQKVNRQLLEETGELWIDPLEDGSIVPHYSAKGKGGEYAVEYLRDIPDLKLTLITMPFLFSNFLGFFAPLPNEGRTQWTLSACFGDGSNKIDMMGVSDLTDIVRKYYTCTCCYADYSFD
jgi:nucleoside-diphosphate-sugar epimerase